MVFYAVSDKLISLWFEKEALRNICNVKYNYRKEMENMQKKI